MDLKEILTLKKYDVCISTILSVFVVVSVTIGVPLELPSITAAAAAELGLVPTNEGGPETIEVVVSSAGSGTATGTRLFFKVALDEPSWPKAPLPQAATIAAGWSSLPGGG